MKQIDSVWLHWPETKALAQAITPLRFVGGCVRDALLTRASSDVDAATPLTPPEIIQRLKAAGFKAIPTGIDHGTVTAVIGARHFEVTTLRRDVETFGRHATVAFTDDWRQDAERRDFTMNALYCDADGRIFDYFGGADDGLKGHVRFIGEARDRIREDALRILRFFRFFAHYGQAPVDEAGIAACGELAGLIDTLSGERIRQEMLKLLIAERAGEVVGLMQRHGVWSYVVKTVVKTNSLGRLPGELRKAHLPPDALLALALLLRGTPKAGAQVETIALRWKLSKAHQKKLAALCDESALWQMASDNDWKKQIREWGKSMFIDRAVIAMAEGAEEACALRAITLARDWQAPEFPVTGNDLLAAGLKPGRELGETLKRLERAWEESGYSLTKDALLSRQS